MSHTRQGREHRLRVRLVGDELPDWVADEVAVAGHQIEHARPGENGVSEQADLAIVDDRDPGASAPDRPSLHGATHLFVRPGDEGDVLQMDWSPNGAWPFTPVGLAAMLDRARRLPVLLVVDDEPDMLLFLRMNAESNGWWVVVAADGMDGLEQAERWQPDVIVLDVMMPRLDGWQTLQQLRRSDHSATTPVVMCTAKFQDVDIARGYHVGCDDYVTTPFDAVRMMQLVAAQLGRVHGEDGPRPSWPDDPVAALRWLRSRSPLLAAPADDAPADLRVETVPGASDGPVHLAGGCSDEDGPSEEQEPEDAVTTLELVEPQTGLALSAAIGDEDEPGPVCAGCLQAILESRPPLDVPRGPALLAAQSLVTSATALRLLEDACDRFDRGELQHFEDVPWAALAEQRRGPLGQALDDARRELTHRLLDRAPEWLLLRHAPGTVDPWQHPRLVAGLGPTVPPHEVPDEATVATRLAALRHMVHADRPWVPVMLGPYGYRDGEGPLGRRPLLAGDGWLVEEVPADLVEEAGWSDGVLPLEPGWTSDMLTVQRLRRTGAFWRAGKRITVRQAWQRINNP